MAFTLSMSGSVQSDPASITDASALLSQSIDLGFTTQLDASFGGNVPIAGVFTPALGAVTKVRFVALRAVDGESLVVLLSWAGGASQAIPVSDLFVLKVTNPDQWLTAVSVSGSGRLEYIVAGNKS